MSIDLSSKAIPIIGRTPPTDSPLLVIFAPTGQIIIPLRAYRITDNAIEFVAYEQDKGVSDTVDIFVGTAIVKKAKGNEYNVDEIDSRYLAN